MRGFAVLMVLLAHTLEEYLPGGVFGVDVFFVLSGYLITGIIVRDAPPLRVFWARRARRLLPALAVVLVSTSVALVLVGDPGRTAEWRGDILSAFGYFTNWWMLGKDVTYDELTTGTSPFAHLWSLAVEEQFYLLWPLLLAIPAVRRRPRVAVAFVVTLGVCSVIYLTAGGASVDRLWYGTDVRLIELGAGALLATVRMPKVPSVVAWAGAAILLVGSAWSATSAVGVALQMGVVTLATLSVLAHLEARPSTVLTRSLSWRPLAGLGVISYGVYLWHIPRSLGSASQHRRPIWCGIRIPSSRHSARPLRVSRLALLDSFRVSLPW